MKKLLTLIGAAAVSFWLYADPAEVNPNTMGFESEELGVPGSIPGALDLYATSQGYPIQWWAYDTNDIAATVTAYETAPADDNHNYLALETGSDPLYRTAAAVTVNENTMTAQQADMTGGVFFDQRVKFSAFDSDPTELSADAKVAVWLKADEERGETNLYISTAVLDAEFVPTLTNIVLHGVNIEPDSWEQLKITAIPAYDLGNDGFLPGFIVQIGNTVLSATETLFPATPEFGTVKAGVAAKMIAERKLFPSRIAFGADEKNPQTLLGVGYQGSGAVDSIEIGEGVDAYEVASVEFGIPENTTIASISAGYGYTDNGDGTYTFAKGDTVTVTLAPVTGYSVSPTSKTFTNIDDETDFDEFDNVVTRDSYAVTFWNGEEVVATTNVTGGTVALPQAAPEAATGYTFAGWFETNTVGEVVADAFDFENTVITNALDLFAQFTNTLYDIYVAEIVGGDKYESLADAVEAAGADATVRLLDHYSMASTLVVPAEKSITLDLGGYTLTSTAPNSGHQCAILNYGTLGVSNGTFTATATTLIRTPGGTVTIYDGTYTAAQNGISCAPASGSALPWATGSTINFRGGSLKTVEMGLLTGKSANSTITVTGGTLTSTDNACIGDNGTANCGGHTINVTGATLNASITSSGYVACGIYIANSTALVVSNTTITVTGGCGILARGGNVTVQDGTAITTTGIADGKVGDSRMVVPCAAVVFDSGSAYPGYNPSTTEVVINGGTFSSAVTSVQLVGDAEKISIPSTSTAQFSDSNAAGVEAGYELVFDGGTRLYKVAVSTYTLTYVTDKGTAPDAVTYTIESNDFALAAAPAGVEGFDFLGWVIGTTTNKDLFVVADHLANTTATAAWAESAPVGPTVDGQTVEPTEVFNYANSAKPITYTTAPTLSGEEGSQTITWGGKTVDVPNYYTASLEGTTVSLSLNENAIPEIAGATSSDPAMVVGSTTVSVGLATTNPKLYYGLSSCSTVGGTYAAPASLTKGDNEGGAIALSVDRGSGETTKFYKVYVTDVAPVTP